MAKELSTKKNQKSFLAAVFLSLFLGIFGVDRLYLGKTDTGILKLMTLGGFGVWYIIDLVAIYTGKAKDVHGDELLDRDKDLTVALVVGIIFVAVGIISSVL
jgi:hypothetical protein